MKCMSRRRLIVDSDELWKVFPTDDRYEISNKGRVRNKETQRILKPSNGGNGYLFLPRYRDGVFSGMYLHQAVALAFIGERPDGCDVSHLDGDKTNNCLSNIIYESKKENMYRKRQHGTHNNGDKNGQAKLTRGEVLEIRTLYITGNYSYRKLAKLFGVSSATIGRAVRRVSWRGDFERIKRS